MIKEKYWFKVFDKLITCEDLSVQDYLELNYDPELFLKKILWKKVWLLNQRQIKNLISFLLNPDEKDLLKLFNKTTSKDNKGMEIDDFFILEWVIMKNLNQQRSEIRKWEWKYFLKVTKNLDVIMWEKKYEDYKYADKPDKKEIKNLLSKK